MPRRLRGLLGAGKRTAAALRFHADHDIRRRSPRRPGSAVQAARTESGPVFPHRREQDRRARRRVAARPGASEAPLALALVPDRPRLARRGRCARSGFGLRVVDACLRGRGLPVDRHPRLLSAGPGAQDLRGRRTGPAGDRRRAPHGVERRGDFPGGAGGVSGRRGQAVLRSRRDRFPPDLRRGPREPARHGVRGGFLDDHHAARPQRVGREAAEHEIPIAPCGAGTRCSR
jgi:hypothetical protein